MQYYVGGCIVSESGEFSVYYGAGTDVCYDNLDAWREADWKIARDWIALLRQGSQYYMGIVATFAEKAEEHYSSALLDKAERKWFGELLTGGTHPKRQRFWRFVKLQMQGKCPRDLRHV